MCLGFFFVFFGYCFLKKKSGLTNCFIIVSIFVKVAQQITKLPTGEGGHCLIINLFYIENIHHLYILSKRVSFVSRPQSSSWNKYLLVEWLAICINMNYICIFFLRTVVQKNYFDNTSGKRIRSVERNSLLKLE